MSSKKQTTDTKEEGKPALVPKLRFPDFRGKEGWEVKKLSTMVQLVSGMHLSPEQYGNEGEVPYFTGPSDFTNDVQGITKRASDSASLANKEDTLITVKGNGVGALWYLTLPSVAMGRQLMAVRSIDAASRFVFQFLLTKRRRFADLAAGNLIPGLSRGDILDLEAPFPSPAEQQRIAECLSSVDEVIAAQARKVDALKAHKKGLMQQLFPREGETQPRLRFPEFQSVGEWDLKPFEEFVTKSFYGTSSSTSPTGRYPVLRMGNMLDGGLDFTNLVYLDLDPDSFERFRLEDGDILLNRTNSPALVGKISLFRLKSECMTASYIVTYRLNKKRLDPSFCNSMLNTSLYQARIRSFAKPSVSQVNINPTTLKKDLIVSVPSLPEQHRIANCLSSLDALITAATQELDILKRHTRGLMQQLFPSLEEVAG